MSGYDNFYWTEPYKSTSYLHYTLGILCFVLFHFLWHSTEYPLYDRMQHHFFWPLVVNIVHKTEKTVLSNQDGSQMKHRRRSQLCPAAGPHYFVAINILRPSLKNHWATCSWLLWPSVFRTSPAPLVHMSPSKWASSEKWREKYNMRARHVTRTNFWGASSTGALLMRMLSWSLE